MKTRWRVSSPVWGLITWLFFCFCFWPAASRPLERSGLGWLQQGWWHGQKQKYCQVILFKKNFIFQFDLQLRDLLNVSGLGWLNKGGDMVKAKKPPGNSFQKNFIFQFDCAASSPLCYAIPKKRQSSLQTHRGKWRAAAAASARKWRQFDLSTVLKQNVCLYLCVICRYNIYKKDFLYTTKF